MSLFSLDTRALMTKFAAAAVAARIGTDRATNAAAEDLLTKTIPVTPVEYGDLRGSGRVEKAGFGDYAVVFGGPEAPYAIYVHERMDLQHAAPTKAKYLESTYLENKDNYLDFIKTSVLGGIFGV